MFGINQGWNDLVRPPGISAGFFCCGCRSQSNIPALPSDMYNTATLLKYLLNYCSDEFFLHCLACINDYWSVKCGLVRLADSLRTFDLGPVGRFVKDHFQPITLEDGRTRLSIKPTTHWQISFFVAFKYGFDTGGYANHAAP
ncbi:hypothetical protein E1B28_003473 [Marasmius oreades]|uniref:Uncharacterized protein n=1 Tax=Marasmius oreades TaxID=181124 RepID=A0A9P7RMP0_9AGAR|nr:uncharacterized protein E1B28_003473 [Marasmius oreades]KAG7085945.1 hypothetical protein E1B28_003473 [Marasmius oreades]